MPRAHYDPPMPARVSDTMASLGLLILRLFAGGILIYGHGWPKLMKWREAAATFPDPIGIGSVAGFWLVAAAETLCSALVLLGWFTRVACVLPIGFFLIAFFVQHAADPFRQKELALLFLAVFACLFFTGPGRFALDEKFGPRFSFRG